MKWIDLTSFGCELYIHSDNANSRNPETGLPDFRIKVIDNALYQESLLEGSSSLSESPIYKEMDTPNLYQRTSNTNLSPEEFSQMFGKRRVTSDIIVDKSLDDVVFQGHIIDLDAYGIEFNTVNFEGEKRPSLILEMDKNSQTLLNGVYWSDVFRTVAEESDLSVNIGSILNENPNPGFQEWHGSLFHDENGEQMGAYVYFNNVNENTIQVLSTDIEKGLLKQTPEAWERMTVKYNHFQTEKRMPESSLESLVEKVEGLLDPSSMFKSTRKSINVIDESFNVLFDKEEVKPLKSKLDSFKVYTLKENGLSQGTLYALKDSDPDYYQKLVQLVGNSSTNLDLTKMNYRPWYLSPSFLNSDELRVAFDNKEALVKRFGLENLDDIVEVDISNESNRLVSIDQNGLMLFTSTNNPIERARYSAFNEGNSFKMKIIFDEFKNQSELLSQVVNVALTTLDESNPGIEKAFSDIVEKVSLIVNFKGLLSGDLDYLDEEYQVQESEVSNLNSYSMKNLIGRDMIQDIAKIKELRDTYFKNVEQQKLEDERKAKEALLEQQRKETLIAVNDFIESESSEEDSKDKIQDYGEKIGGAVKDDYRFLSKNLITLSHEEYSSLLSNVDQEDLSRLAKKSVVLSPFNPIELKAEEVDSRTAYAIKLLTLAMPTSAEKAGIPPTNYIHAVKKMHEIMYRNRGLHFNDFTDAVKAELDKEFFFEDVTEEKAYYSLRKIEPDLFSNMLAFETTEDMLKAVEKERAEKKIFSKYSRDEVNYKFDGDDPMTEEERAISNLTYLTYDFNKQFKIACTACLGKVVENLYIRPYRFSSKVRNATSYVNEWYKMITPAMLKKQEKAQEKAEQDSKDLIDNDEPGDKEETNFEKALGTLKLALKNSQINSKEIKHLGHVVREGEDYQVNDINEKVFAGYFGFRAVEFGEWLPQKERKVVLQHAFDAFMDLTLALRLATEEASLGGELAMAFGSRGRSSALAHFEPGRNVINLTRMKSAGSLAHEFGHALDKHIVNYFCEKYPSFKLLTKNGGFISQFIVKNANSKKYKVSLDSDIIRQMRNVITGDLDKSLLNSYIDLHKTLLLRKNSEELRIERYAEKVMNHKDYASRSIVNMVSSVYYAVYQNFESHYGEPEATNRQREYRKAHEGIIREKEFDRYIQDVVTKEVFDLHSLNDKLFEAFGESEKCLYDKDSSEFRTVPKTDYRPSVEKIQSIISEHVSRGQKELIEVVSQFVPVPDDFEIPEVDKEIVLPYSFDYSGEKISYEIKIEDPFLKYLYSQSKEFGGDSYRLYKGAFDYLVSTATERVKSQETRSALRMAIVNHGKELKDLEQTYTNPDLNSYNDVETQYFVNATKLDKNKYYYRQPIELFARSFESYVFDELEKKGQKNDYLVSSSKAPGKQDKHSSRYPLDYERKVINEKIDSLMRSYSQAMELDSQIEKELER